jgi:hypothetical protein
VKERRSRRRRRRVVGWLWQILVFEFSPLFIATNSTATSNANHISHDFTTRPGHSVLSTTFHRPTLTYAGCRTYEGLDLIAFGQMFILNYSFASTGSSRRVRWEIADLTNGMPNLETINLEPI